MSSIEKGAKNNVKQKWKKLTACALAFMLGMACIGSPVSAAETETSQQADAGGLQEIDENAVPINDTMETESSGETEQTQEPESKAQIRAVNSIMTMAAKNAGDFNVTGGTASTDWVFDETENTLTFNASGTYEITGDGTATTERIIISDCSFNGTITLNNVNINASSKNSAAFIANNDYTNTNVTIVLKGINKLQGAGYKAGLAFNNNQETSSLTIEGEGALTAIGGNSGAGIGGNYDQSTRNIYIKSGTVVTRGDRGAGIGGGGRYGRADNIVISGGNVTAYGSYCASAIGSALYGSPSSNIKITGGTVTATGSSEYTDVHDIVVTDGSFKVGSMSEVPTDGAGNNIYLVKLDNLSGVNSVTVDSKSYTREGDHPNDGAFYLYLTGTDHEIETVNGKYRAIWNGSDAFTLKQYLSAPTVEIEKATASSITVKPLSNATTYGGAKYSLNGSDWYDSNVFTGLNSKKYGGDNYTVYAKYVGNDSYFESDVGTKANISTNSANYLISIPKTAAADGSDNIIKVSQENTFDLGRDGKVNVSIKDTGSIKNGYLTLTRENSTETLTSALSVGGSPWTDISKVLVTFNMSNYKTESKTISFAQPKEQNILAGTYKGTVTFEISYSE